ncbi:coiled-coil domain-containing protein [Wohlfahrtiimonas chitiniclastica]|uniref:coiled-coil domain-containing protein n=1 Tax=Wohlfahrtiimonas chitiniclastica TaxID=400946 RepID=UPI00035F5285|nr:hypothetical protein [Wohlfahrtiimonas chitiniclastica]
MSLTMKLRHHLLWILLALSMILWPSHAVEAETTQNTPNAQAAPSDSITDQLATIVNDMKELQDKKTALTKEIKAERDDAHKQELEESLTRTNTQLKEYTALFEKIALGGIDTSRFDTPAKQAIQQVDDYDWQKELVQIAQPVFAEMKKITDAPRKRDVLRLEQKEIDERLSMLDKGLATFAQINLAELPETAQKNLKDIEAGWQNLHKELERERKLVVIKLDELTTKEGFTTRLYKGAWSFMTGRGLLLLITIATLSGLMYLFNRFLVFIEKREKNNISIQWRVFILLYQIITTLVAVLVTLMILYSSGDMVLFGIAILIILAFLVTSRNSIPKYFTKTRIFLNIGQAREGERVIYNDLPWKISRINLYTVYLTNPLLENGTVRLTIDHLNNMISRPVKMDETWFPTVVGDVIYLNGTQYKVMRQTPEYVYLTSSGTEIIYPSKDFIKDKVLNVSYGYYISTELSLNYAAINGDIDAVITTLQEALNARIQAENPDAHKAIKSLTIDFNRIDEQNNAVFLIAFSMGSFATDYRGSIIRLAQRCAVKTAQEHNWSLKTIRTFSIDESKPAQ